MADAVRVVMLILAAKIRATHGVCQANKGVLHHKSCSTKLPRIVKGHVPETRRLLLVYPLLLPLSDTPRTDPTPQLKRVPCQTPSCRDDRGNAGDENHDIVPLGGRPTRPRVPSRVESI